MAIGPGRLRGRRVTVGLWRPGPWRCRSLGHRQGLAEELDPDAPDGTKALASTRARCRSVRNQSTARRRGAIERSSRTDARWLARYGSRLGNRRDRHLEAWDPSRELRALARRGIGREPAQ